MVSHGRFAPQLFPHGGTQKTFYQKVLARWCASSTSLPRGGRGASVLEVVSVATFLREDLEKVSGDDHAEPVYSSFMCFYLFF